MSRFRRKPASPLNRDRGSMPIALFITVMFLVLSVGIISLVATQIAQNRAEDNARIANWSLGSSIAMVAEKIGPSARALTNLATTEPSTWTNLSAANNNAFYHWWVSSSSNAILNTSTLPAGAWSSAVYGNNTWVAINTAGTAFTSPDGINWTQRNTLPNAGTLFYTNVTYGLGKFIATPNASSTNIATSADGITWTSVAVTAGVYIPSCSTTTCILLSSTSATGYYTSDLSTFTLIPTVPLTTKDIIFSISTFVATGNNAIATSPNGVNWTTRTASNHNWGLVGAVNGILVAADVQAAGSTNIITSSDSGVTWADHTLPNAGNWIALTTAGPQLGLFSGPISGTSQSTYLASSTGLTWVNNSMSASAAWIGATSNYKSFLVYPATNPAYLIPITAGVNAAQQLTVSTRVQTGRVTGANNGQYLASMTFNWNVANKRWMPSKYLGSSSSSLSIVPDAPTGVTGTRTGPGTIVVSWIPPVSSGSSAVSSYSAVSSPGGYNCPNGGQLSGTTCTLTTTSAATYNGAYYSCTSGDTLSGTTCTHTTTYAANYTPSSYSCTSGDTLSVSTCTHTYTSLYSGATYQCNSGDTPSGIQLSAVTCTHTYSANYTATTYQCTSGDSPSGVQASAVTCTNTYTVAGTPNYTAYPVTSTPNYTAYPVTSTPNYSNYPVTPNYTNYPVTTIPGYYTCPSGGSVGAHGSGVCEYGASISYSCTGAYAGYTLSGSTCTQTTVVSNSHLNYSCPTSPYIYLSGSSCYNHSTLTGSNIAAQNNTYCPGGGTNSNTTGAGTCTTTNSGPATPNGTCPSGGAYNVYGDGHCTYSGQWNATSYQCNSGGSWNGSNCGSYVSSYSCNSGGSWNGNNCGSYVSSYTYSCNSGGSWNGSDCGSYISSYSYSCNSGGSWNGSNCGSYISSYTYTCNPGDTGGGGSSTCTHTYTSPVLVAAYYSCNSGDTPGTTSPTTFTCSHTYTAPGAAAYYYCNSGDTPNTTSASTFTCTHTYAATFNAAFYSCTSGDTPATTSASTFTCTHTTTYGATYNVAVYTCSSGSVSGNLCILTSTYTATYNAGGYSCVSSSATNCTISNMADGAYTFSVIATNGSGSSVASVASALIQPQLMTISYPSTVFSTTQLSQVMTPVITGSSGATLSYSETGALPSGVTFNTSTGALTGRSSWVDQTGFPLSISVTATDSLTGISVVSPFTFTLITP